MRNWLLSLGLLLLVSAPAFALDLDPKSQKAYTKLKTIPLFAMGGVGFAGTTSEGETALRVLLENKQANVVFQTLLKEATREGQLYALLGLRFTNPSSFTRQVGPFLSMKAKVGTMSGCILSEQPVSTIATAIKKGSYDRGKPGGGNKSTKS
jgi:hypothetical protein